MRQFKVPGLLAKMKIVSEISKNGSPFFVNVDKQGWNDNGRTTFRLLNTIEIEINPNDSSPFWFNVREKNALNTCEPNIETETFIRFSSPRELIAEFQTSETTKEVFFLKHVLHNKAWVMALEHRQESLIERKQPEVVEILVGSIDHFRKPNGKPIKREKGDKHRRTDRGEMHEIRTEVIVPQIGTECLSQKQLTAMKQNCTGPLAAHMVMDYFIAKPINSNGDGEHVSA